MTERADQKHPVTLLAVLGVILAALAGALYMMDRADARVGEVGGQSDAGPLPVDVFTLKRVDIQRKIEARGFFSGIAEVTVPSEVAGRVDHRAVSDGQRVKKGDVLLTVDDTFHQLAHQRAVADRDRAKAQLGRAKARVQQAKAQVESVRAVRDNRQKEYERISELFSGGNAPQVEFDRAETAYKTSVTDLEAVTAALTLARDEEAVAKAAFEAAAAAVEEAHARLERCVVRAPLSGTVNRIFVEPGEYAMASAPLLELIRLDVLKMIVELSGTELAMLDEFDRAVVAADAIPDRELTARLHHVAPAMEPTSKRFRVEFRLDNAGESLLSGMYGKVTIYCGMIDDVLRIPREAVFKHYGGDSCLVVDARDGQHVAELRRIIVRDVPGRLNEMEVLSGLEAGEGIIVTRRRGLHSGVRVKPIAPDESTVTREELASSASDGRVP